MLYTSDPPWLRTAIATKQTKVFIYYIMHVMYIKNLLLESLYLLKKTALQSVG
jgi:hypothetical protein